MMKPVLRELRRMRIIPLVVIDDPAQAGPLAGALVEGGLPCAEIAFRTGGALEALRRLAGERPGVAPPTEVEAALTRGLEVLKFFPAEPMGGLPFLRAIAAPFSGVDFIPTGGMKADRKRP